MSEPIPAVLRALVRERAGGRCEYCLLHEEDVPFPHEPDHIVARKHFGQTEASNLAWTCFNCNRHKGSDLGLIDPNTRRLVRLFDPRRDNWKRHFRLLRSRIVPRTAIGRVTVRLLQLNRQDRVLVRGQLIAAGLYPR